MIVGADRNIVTCMDTSTRRKDLTTRASVSRAITIWREDGLEPAVVYLANLGVPLEVIHRVLIEQIKAKLMRQRDDAGNKN